MTIDMGTLVISTSNPSGNVKSDADRSDWIWLNPSTGELKRYNTSTGQFDIDIPVPSHPHVISDVNDLQDQLNDKAEGDHTHSEYSGSFEGTISKIVVENGIVTEVELEE